MKTILYIIFLTGLIFPQDTSKINTDYFPFQVDSIEIKGIDITDPDIIRRELTFKEGDSITYDNMMYNRERVFSLGIFNRVDLFTTQEDTTDVLVIDVEESWYIYPVPFAELKDKSWDKISYGLDFYIKNFRGRNETLRIRGALGYDPNIFMNYTVPSLTSDGNYYLFTELVYTKFRNKSKYGLLLAGENFDQKYLNGSLGLGKRFGLYHRASIYAGYTYIENPVYIPGISASSDAIDRYPSIGLNYSYDTRDLAQFPNNGILLNSGLIFKGFGVNEISYQILNIDFREYRPIWGDLAGKWRLGGRFGFGGLIPTHDFSYLGFGERIRGYFSEEMEGHNLYLASAELYYPVFKDMRVNLDFVPLLPRELLHYRAGLYIQFFMDAGTTKLRHEKLSYKDFVSGYGTGITILVLPYNILRAEFAVSENGSTEWIIDLGISF
jgi:outer membrane protein assembly factor BamA